MLLFRSEGNAEKWMEKNKVLGGETVGVAQVWELSKLWYKSRLDSEYHGRSAEEAEKIFREVGLRSPFWEAK